MSLFLFLSSCRRVSIYQSRLARSLSPPLRFCRPLARSLLFSSPPQQTHKHLTFVCLLLLLPCTSSLSVYSSPSSRSSFATFVSPRHHPHDTRLHTSTSTHRPSASRYSCRDFLYMLDIDLRPSARSPRPLNLIPSTKPHCCVGVGSRKRVWPSWLCECVKVCLCITRWRRMTFEGLYWVQLAQEEFTVYCSKAK